MNRASIRDLHMRTGALVQQAADGEVIIIEKRGIAVAELEPIKKLTAAEVFRERERSGYYKKFPKTKGELSRFISEDRIR
jgi:antitoxin (DNA-binding transcriptional repressor) of toxin-antitoxin stability system